MLPTPDGCATLARLTGTTHSIFYRPSQPKALGPARRACAGLAISWRGLELSLYHPAVLRKRLFPVLVAVPGLLLGGCDRNRRELRLTDTEGRTFKATCEGSEAGCAYARISAPSVSKEQSEVRVESSGRLVGVCDAAPGKPAEAGHCRALVCTSDADCPLLDGLASGHCLNGLCISPEKPLNASDAVLLCLAGTGLGRNAPSQVARFAMALNCGKPCKIPSPCRQP